LKKGCAAWSYLQVRSEDFFFGQRVANVETETVAGIYCGQINGSNYEKSVHEKPASNLSCMFGILLGNGPYADPSGRAV
jgi:hypothetical protein